MDSPSIVMQFNKGEAVKPISVIHKFGRRVDVSTSYQALCYGADYHMPTAATAVEAVSDDNIQDKAGGTGALTVTVVGLDENWAEASETLTMNGTTASTASTTTFLRVFRAYIATSGAYATATQASSTGQITVRAESAGTTFAIIDKTKYPQGQSEIAAYTVPANKKAFITSIAATVETSKPAELILMQRQNADTIAAPFSPARLVQHWPGLQAPFSLKPITPLGPFPAKTDLWFMGTVASTAADMAVDFEIILTDA